MLFIVSGAIGIGKTTVCRKLLAIARRRGLTCGGILTDKSADGGITVEDIRTGAREVLASTRDIYDGPRTERYFFSPEGIEFGIGAIARGASSDLLMIDEIGPVELAGGGFTNAIGLVNTGKPGTCLLVIRSALLAAFLPQLNARPLIFRTTVDSRGCLPSEIAARLPGD